MKLSSAIKLMRRELGLTQVDLANVLHVTSGSVSRWELGKVAPTRVVTSMMIQYACSKDLSNECVESLMQAVDSENRIRIKTRQGENWQTDIPTLGSIVNEIALPLYISDYETDEILYINKSVKSIINCTMKQAHGKKCYELLMNRDTPCEFCHKKSLGEDKFTGYNVIFPLNGKEYRVEGKVIMWNGAKATVHYVASSTESFKQDRLLQ